MSDLLVIGNGYIGWEMFTHLTSLKHNVILVSRNDLDYHDQTIFKKYLLDNNIETVINCSGFTGRPNVDEGEIKKELCWKLNVSIPLQLATTCNSIGVKLIHISSGCIYNGYEKDYTEIDPPNFGLSNYSSFYSKTKHEFEIVSKDKNLKILRIRMPITNDSNDRNYLKKILNYDNLIDFKNSKTYIPDLANVVDNLLKVDMIDFWRGQDIYNVVNPEPLTTREVCEIMKSSGKENKNWKFVDMKDLQIKAPRSNCVLDGSKLDSLYKMRTETEIIKEALQYV